jgi:N-acetylmuramoyl-L-alanine amidase
MIFISAGHNPKDVGAVAKGQTEYELNAKFAAAAMDVLGYEAQAVPTGTLREKIDWINERCGKDDIAIEIHMNANRMPSVSGTEVYYAFEQDKAVAETLDRAVANILGVKGRARDLNAAHDIGCMLPFDHNLGRVVHDSQSGIGSLGWCRQVKCHAVILEVGYMTNAKDMAALQAQGTPLRVAGAIKRAFVQHEDIRTLQQRVIDLSRIVVDLLREILRLKS